jgi:magnesium chelatase family protein
VVNVERVKRNQLLRGESSEPTETVRNRVIATRKVQSNRFAKENINSNNEMNNKQIQKYCELDERAKDLLEQAINNLKLSARAYMRVLKVGRTIADMDESENISAKHVAEALQYRI